MVCQQDQQSLFIQIMKQFNIIIIFCFSVDVIQKQDQEMKKIKEENENFAKENEKLKEELKILSEKIEEQKVVITKLEEMNEPDQQEIDQLRRELASK